MVEPVFDSAKKAVEPALESARNIVEPYVESSKEKAAAIRDFGAQKIDEYLYTSTPGKEAGNNSTCIDSNTSYASTNDSSVTSATGTEASSDSE